MMMMPAPVIGAVPPAIGQGVNTSGTRCVAAKISLSMASNVLTSGDSGSQ